MLMVLARILNHRASRPTLPPGANDCGLVVLGYPSRRDGSPHLIQRRRVDAALRTISEHGARVVVMTGGAVRNDVPEAETMVRLAEDLGVDASLLRAESEAQSTWENVRYSRPLVTECAAVVIVSEPMHAARARRYWIKQFPEDAGRVFVDRRGSDLLFLTTPATLYGLAMAVTDRIHFGL